VQRNGNAGRRRHLQEQLTQIDSGYSLQYQFCDGKPPCHGLKKLAMVNHISSAEPTSFTKHEVVPMVMAATIGWKQKVNWQPCTYGLRGQTRPRPLLLADVAGASSNVDRLTDDLPIQVNASILLVEPHDHLRDAYTEALRDAGFNVTAVARLTEAFAIGPKLRPSVIVANLDPQPREELLSYVEKLQADRRTLAKPVLLMSEHVERHDLQFATDVGALIVAVGPFDKEKLVATVQGVLAAQS
jgi:CheY-like chemotaxis protein